MTAIADTITETGFNGWKGHIGGYSRLRVASAPAAPVDLHARQSISEEMLDFFTDAEELQGRVEAKLEAGLFDVARRERIDIFRESVRFIQPYYVPATQAWVVEAVAWGYPQGDPS